MYTRVSESVWVWRKLGQLQYYCVPGDSCKGSTLFILVSVCNIYIMYMINTHMYITHACVCIYTTPCCITPLFAMGTIPWIMRPQFELNIQCIHQLTLFIIVFWGWVWGHRRAPFDIVANISIIIKCFFFFL